MWLVLGSVAPANGNGERESDVREVVAVGMGMGLGLCRVLGCDVSEEEAEGEEAAENPVMGFGLVLGRLTRAGGG